MDRRGLVLEATICNDGDDGGAEEVEDEVFHGVLKGGAALERGGVVEGAAACEELLRVEAEDAVGDVLEYFPHGSGAHGEAYDPYGHK